MKRPNVFQRLMHRVIMYRPMTEFLAPRTKAIDAFFLKLTKGKHTLTELFGWNIVHVTTVGAKSGREIKLILIAIAHEDKLALIASNFGRPHNPSWYYNLLKTPQCKVQLNGVDQLYVAREAQGAEREQFWRLAVNHYAGYEKYSERAAPRRIPILLLESLK
ncbi:nitroreductase/quinone reductase family protein [Chloroflexota bacterium]